MNTIPITYINTQDSSVTFFCIINVEPECLNDTCEHDICVMKVLTDPVCMMLYI